MKQNFHFSRSGNFLQLRKTNIEVWDRTYFLREKSFSTKRFSSGHVTEHFIMMDLGHMSIPQIGAVLLKGKCFGFVNLSAFSGILWQNNRTFFEEKFRTTWICVKYSKTTENYKQRFKRKFYWNLTSSQCVCFQFLRLSLQYFEHCASTKINIAMEFCLELQLLTF